MGILLPTKVADVISVYEDYLNVGQLSLLSLSVYLAKTCRGTSSLSCLHCVKNLTKIVNLKF